MKTHYWLWGGNPKSEASVLRRKTLRARKILGCLRRASGIVRFRSTTTILTLKKITTGNLHHPATSPPPGSSPRLFIEGSRGSYVRLRGSQLEDRNSHQHSQSLGRQQPKQWRSSAIPQSTVKTIIRSSISLFYFKPTTIPSFPGPAFATATTIHARTNTLLDSKSESENAVISAA